MGGLLTGCLALAGLVDPPAAAAQQREVVVTCQVVDTGGTENEDGETVFADPVVYRLTVRSTAQGVIAVGDAGTSPCQSRGRADFLPAAGQEELFECAEACSALVLRAADGTLPFIDHSEGGASPSITWEIALADLTGDGRSEAILTKQIDGGAFAIGEISVLTFEEAGARSIFAVHYGEDGSEDAHSVSVRAAAGGHPAAVVHVETRGRRRTEQALVYDAASRQLAPERRRGRGR